MSTHIEPIDPSRELILGEAFRDPFFASLAEEFVGDLEGTLILVRRHLHALTKDAEALRPLRAVIHSLKGAGGTNGYEVVSLICHAFEECIDLTAKAGRTGELGFRQIAEGFVELIMRFRELARAGATDFGDLLPEINRVIQDANGFLASDPEGPSGAGASPHPEASPASVTLRDAIDREEPDTPQTSATDEPEAPRVLLVDGPGLYRRLLKRLIEEEGIAVEEADDVPQALARLVSAPVDLILTCRGLEGLSGLSLIAAVRVDAHLTSIPIVLVQPAVADDPPEACRPDRIVREGTTAAVLAAVRSFLRAQVAG